MRYLTLAEALVIAEAVTGIDHAVLANTAGVGLLDSALHAPQAGFGGYELYAEFTDKAAGSPCGSLATTLSLTATSDWPGLPHRVLPPRRSRSRPPVEAPL